MDFERPRRPGCAFDPRLGAGAEQLRGGPSALAPRSFPLDRHSAVRLFANTSEPSVFRGVEECFNAMLGAGPSHVSEHDDHVAFDFEVPEEEEPDENVLFGLASLCGDAGAVRDQWRAEALVGLNALRSCLLELSVAARLDESVTSISGHAAPLEYELPADRPVRFPLPRSVRAAAATKGRFRTDASLRLCLTLTGVTKVDRVAAKLREFYDERFELGKAPLARFPTVLAGPDQSVRLILSASRELVDEPWLSTFPMIEFAKLAEVLSEAEYFLAAARVSFHVEQLRLPAASRRPSPRPGHIA